MRAVYWRLFKAGIEPILSAENYGSPRTASSYELGASCMLEIHGCPHFDGTQYLNVLVQHLRFESSRPDHIFKQLRLPSSVAVLVLWQTFSLTASSATHSSTSSVQRRRESL